MISLQTLLYSYYNFSSRYRYKKGGNAFPNGIRSAKSLEFEEETKPSARNTVQCRKSSEVDYTSEPMANCSRLRNGRPTPPKKPLRLSLQRAQSLQTIEANAAATIVDLERKRAIKRTHRGNETPDSHQYIDCETNLLYTSPIQLQTASLGRNK